LNVGRYQHWLKKYIKDGDTSINTAVIMGWLNWPKYNTCNRVTSYMPKSFEFNNTKGLKNDKKDPKKSPLYSAIRVLPKKKVECNSE
jgi:hypothetical protein